MKESARQQAEFESMLIALAGSEMAPDLEDCADKLFQVWLCDVARYNAVKTSGESPFPVFLSGFVRLCLSLRESETETETVTSSAALEQFHQRLCTELSAYLSLEWCSRYVTTQSAAYQQSRCIESVKLLLSEDDEMFNELFDTFSQVDAEMDEVFTTDPVPQGTNVIPMTRHSNALAVKQYEFKQQFMEHMGVDMEQVSVAIKEIEDAHGSLDVASQLSQSHLERAMAFMTERLKRPPQ